jgi:hypothetical protein
LAASVECVFPVIQQLAASLEVRSAAPTVGNHNKSLLEARRRLRAVSYVDRILKMLWGGSGEHISIAARTNAMNPTVTKPKTKTVNDFSRCPLGIDATLIAVIDMSQSSWLVAGIVPGVERQPLKRLAIDEHALLGLLKLAAQGIEAHVIHASSVAVTREHRRAKTDRLDTELLKRGFLGWLLR